MGFFNFQFFSSLKPDFPGFIKFLSGVLRSPGADPDDFEVAVERCVWDIVKFDYKEFVSGSVLSSALFVAIIISPKDFIVRG